MAVGRRDIRLQARLLEGGGQRDEEAALELSVETFEHLNQASVPVQIGRLDAAGLPAAGLETARKTLDGRSPATRR
jgi:hypothetical protein